jgi:hypothetical protein
MRTIEVEGLNKGSLSRPPVSPVRTGSYMGSATQVMLLPLRDYNGK